MNKLIVIGWGMGPHAGVNANRGVRRCYLNISREEALRRYIGATDLSEVDLTGSMSGHPLPITEVYFNDWFEVYDIWPMSQGRCGDG